MERQRSGGPVGAHPGITEGRGGGCPRRETETRGWAEPPFSGSERSDDRLGFRSVDAFWINRSDIRIRNWYIMVVVRRRRTVSSAVPPPPTRLWPRNRGGQADPWKKEGGWSGYTYSLGMTARRAHLSSHYLALVKHAFIGCRNVPPESHEDAQGRRRSPGRDLAVCRSVFCRGRRLLHRDIGGVMILDLILIIAMK